MEYEVFKELIKVPGQLDQFNKALESLNLPVYWGRDKNNPNEFNTEYRTTPFPRFVVRFRGWWPRLVLQQIYVIYLPNQVEYTWDTRQPDLIHTRWLTEEEKANL